MSAHIGIVTVPGHGCFAVSASLSGVEVERTVEERRVTLQPHEALNLAMLLTRAVSECHHMRTAEGEVDKLVEALMWCSGSSDFAPGGIAHEGFVKGVKPLIDSHMALKHQAHKKVGGK